MEVILDEREAHLYDRCTTLVQGESHTKSSTALKKAVLPLGDVLLKYVDQDVLLIERKSLQDLLASIKDGRYEEQSYRLIHASDIHPHNIVYLIEGQLSTLRSPQEKRMVYSAMTTLQTFKGFSVIRTGGLQETAEWIIATADKLAREIAGGKNPRFANGHAYTDIDSNNLPTPPPYCSVVKKTKKDNITSDNIGEIVLCQIPGISAITATAIMKNYTSFPHFLETLRQDPACLDNVYCESQGKRRKLAKTAIANICQYLGKPCTPPTPLPV